MSLDTRCCLCQVPWGGPGAGQEVSVCGPRAGGFCAHSVLMKLPTGTPSQCDLRLSLVALSGRKVRCLGTRRGMRGRLRALAARGEVVQPAEPERSPCHCSGQTCGSLGACCAGWFGVWTSSLYPRHLPQPRGCPHFTEGQSESRKPFGASAAAGGLVQCKALESGQVFCLRSHRHAWPSPPGSEGRPWGPQQPWFSLL